jgi:hypothetical protein
MRFNVDAARVHVANKLEVLAERVRGDVPWTFDGPRSGEPDALELALEVLECERAIVEGTPPNVELPALTLRRVIVAARVLDKSERTTEVQTWRAWLHANALPTTYRPGEGA